MQVIRPQPINDYMLVSTNVPDDDYPVWAPGSYSEGDRVVAGAEAYEALADTDDEPGAGARTALPTWLRLGFTNQWRMFRDGVDSKTQQDGGITVELVSGTVVNGLALLGLEGLSFTVTMTDSTEGAVYEKTEPITYLGVDSWYDYFFLPYDIKEDFVLTDLPPYPGATIQVEVETNSPSDPAAVGRLVLGMVRDIGGTLYGTSARTLDFSTRERDGFGNLRIVGRRYVDLVDYRVSIETPRLDYVKRELDQLRNRETVFIGTELYGTTVVFGFYRDFGITISNHAFSDITIEVEGY